MIDLVSPPPASTSSVLADWMELQALTSERGTATGAQIVRLIELAGDNEERNGAFDDETGEAYDPEIADLAFEAAVAEVFDELDHRCRCLGESYPFSLVGGRRPRLERAWGIDLGHAGRAVYVFCLLASALRTKMLRASNEDGMTRSLANVFQVCACLAAGGYIAGEVCSFGFPRAQGTGFLRALQEAYTRVGSGEVVRHDRVPPLTAAAQIKDGGIDVIAWRHMPDRMPGKTYLLGQCASGANWRSKSVVEYVEPFHGLWFTRRPESFWLPAMFIPFPLQHDLVRSDGQLLLDMLNDLFWREQMRFGIVFDRLRLAYYANVCMTRPEGERQGVDGAAQYSQIRQWIEGVLNGTAFRQA